MNDTWKKATMGDESQGYGKLLNPGAANDIRVGWHTFTGNGLRMISSGDSIVKRVGFSQDMYSDDVLVLVNSVTVCTARELFADLAAPTPEEKMLFELEFGIEPPLFSDHMISGENYTKKKIEEVKRRIGK